MAGHNGTLNPSFVSAFDMSRVHNALRRLEHTGSLSLSSAGVDAEHWLLAFLGDLLAQFRASDEISFEATQELLQQHEQAFRKDLETARRMYRTYPHLFLEENSQQASSAQA